MKNNPNSQVDHKHPGGTGVELIFYRYHEGRILDAPEGRLGVRRLDLPLTRISLAIDDSYENVPALRASFFYSSSPRADARGYSLPALRAWISMYWHTIAVVAILCAWWISGPKGR